MVDRFLALISLLICISPLGAQVNQAKSTLENFENIEIQSEIDSLESNHENRLYSPADELYKNQWNSTNIKYPITDFVQRNDTLVISLVGSDDKPFFPPYNGKVISKFGPRSGRMHTGTDIKLHLGDSVHCAFDGKVRLAKRFSGYGNLVLVRHNNGLETIYAHLKSIKVKVGDQVYAGDLIGLGGHTGRATTDHLHFETRIFGEPFDSEKYIDFENHILKCDYVYYKNKQITIDVKKIKCDLPYNIAAVDQSSEIESKAALKMNVDLKNHDVLAQNEASTEVKHVISKGDNLWAISKRYNTSVKNICEANKISTRQTLRVGTVLIIR